MTSLTILTLTNGDKIMGEITGRVSVFSDGDENGLRLKNPFNMIVNRMYPGYNFERYNFEKNDIIIIKSNVVSVQSDISEDIIGNYNLKKELYVQCLDKTVAEMIEKENKAFRDLFDKQGKFSTDHVDDRVKKILGIDIKTNDKDSKEEKSNIIDFINNPKIH